MNANERDIKHEEFDITRHDIIGTTNLSAIATEENLHHVM